MQHKSNSRTANSLRNMAFGLSGQLISIPADIVARTVFIYLLGKTYLGAVGLMNNILAIMSISELGIGTAIIYALYRPIADHDEAKIRSLMRLYKKAYFLVGLAIACLSLGFIPFMPMINGYENVSNFELIYLLYLAKTLVSYWFFACNSSFLIADQKRYIVTAVETATHIGMLVTQIVLLLITKNFILYLVLAILWQMITQYATHRRTMRLYPFLREKDAPKLDKTERSGIFKNVFALSLNKVSTTAVSSTDNVIISTNGLLGLNAVGVYDNYMLLAGYVNRILKSVFFSATASIGNLNTTETPEKKEFVFNCMSFLNFWLYGFCGVCLYVLLDPFIRLWLTQDNYVLGHAIKAAIVLNFVTEGLGLTVIAFRDACGLHWRNPYRPIATVVLNLGISIALVQPMGLLGVVLGTILSRMLTTWWFDSYIVYRFVFLKKPFVYYTRYLLFLLLICLAGELARYACSLIGHANISGFLLSCLACVLLPNALFALFTFRLPEFEYFVGVVKKLALSAMRRVQKKR